MVQGLFAFGKENSGFHRQSDLVHAIFDRGEMNSGRAKYRTFLASAMLAMFSLVCLHQWCQAEEHFCADYSQFRSVLDEGQAEMQRSSPGGYRDLDGRARATYCPPNGIFGVQTTDTAPSEKEVARIQVNSVQDLRLALETADRCVRFERPGLAIPVMGSAMRYTVANVSDSAIIAYVAESLASVIVLDVLGDQSLQSDDFAKKPVATHKSFLNSSLELLASRAESRRSLKSSLSQKEAARLEIAKRYFLQALEARRRAAWHYGKELIYLNLACLATMNGDKLIARDHINDALLLVSDDLKSTKLSVYNAGRLREIWSPNLKSNSFDDTAACILLRTAIEADDSEACKQVESLLAKSSRLRVGADKFPTEFLPLIDIYATYSRGEDALRILSSVPDELPIPTTTLAKLVQVVPENQKQKLFKTSTTPAGDLQTLENAIAMRGWTADAGNWILKSAQKIAPDNSEARQLSLARFYLKRKNFEQSRRIYDDVLARLSKLTDGSAASARVCIKATSSILADIAESRVTWPDTERNAKEIGTRATSRLGVLQCLQLAGDLSKTGWNLELGGKKELALKMYSSAFQISVQNLGAKDQETLSRQLDVARLEGSLGNTQDASKQFEAALTILRKQKGSSLDMLKSGLQDYADLLRRTKQHEKADTIYGELRRIDLTKPTVSKTSAKNANKSVMHPRLMITVNLFKGSKVSDRMKRLFYELDNPNQELQAWLRWQRGFEKELLARLEKNKAPKLKSFECQISFVVGRDRRVSKVKIIEGDAESPWTRRAQRAIENASGNPYLKFPEEAKASERPLVAKVNVWEAPSLRSSHVEPFRD